MTHPFCVAALRTDTHQRVSSGDCTQACVFGHRGAYSTSVQTSGEMAFRVFLNQNTNAFIHLHNGAINFGASLRNLWGNLSAYCLSEPWEFLLSDEVPERYSKVISRPILRSRSQLPESHLKFFVSTVQSSCSAWTAPLRGKKIGLRTIGFIKKVHESTENWFLFVVLKKKLFRRCLWEKWKCIETCQGLNAWILTKTQLKVQLKYENVWIHPLLKT